MFQLFSVFLIQIEFYYGDLIYFLSRMCMLYTAIYFYLIEDWKYFHGLFNFLFLVVVNTRLHGHIFVMKVFIDTSGSSSYSKKRNYGGSSFVKRRARNQPFQPNGYIANGYNSWNSNNFRRRRKRYYRRR